MTRMPDFFTEVERDLGHLIHHRHDAPQPAAAPPIPHNETQEVPPMSLYTELASDARALAAKAESVDHAMLDTLDVVLANPATADAFTVLGDIAHISPPLLATGVEVLKMIRQSAASQPQSIASDAVPAPQQPAGPVVAGQA